MGVRIEGLHLRKGGLRLVQGRLEGTGIDFEEHLTLLDRIPFLVILSDQVARDLRPNSGIHQSVGSANKLAYDRDVFLYNLRDFHNRRRHRRRLFLAARGEPEERGTYKNQQRTAYDGDESVTDPRYSQVQHVLSFL